MRLKFQHEFQREQTIFKPWHCELYQTTPKIIQKKSRFKKKSAVCRTLIDKASENTIQLTLQWWLACSLKHEDPILLTLILLEFFCLFTWKKGDSFVRFKIPFHYETKMTKVKVTRHSIFREYALSIDFVPDHVLGSRVIGRAFK
jgi:hypothetical protein